MADRRRLSSLSQQQNHQDSTLLSYHHFGAEAAEGPSSASQRPAARKSANLPAAPAERPPSAHEPTPAQELLSAPEPASAPEPCSVPEATPEATRQRKPKRIGFPRFRSILSRHVNRQSQLQDSPALDRRAAASQQASAPSSTNSGTSAIAQQRDRSTASSPSVAAASPARSSAVRDRTERSQVKGTAMQHSPRQHPVLEQSTLRTGNAAATITIPRRDRTAESEAVRRERDHREIRALFAARTEARRSQPSTPNYTIGPVPPVSPGLPVSPISLSAANSSPVRSPVIRQTQRHNPDRPYRLPIPVYAHTASNPQWRDAPRQPLPRSAEARSALELQRSHSSLPARPLPRYSASLRSAHVPARADRSSSDGASRSSEAPASRFTWDASSIASSNRRGYPSIQTTQEGSSAQSTRSSTFVTARTSYSVNENAGPSDALKKSKSIDQSTPEAYHHSAGSSRVNVEAREPRSPQHTPLSETDQDLASLAAVPGQPAQPVESSNGWESLDEDITERHDSAVVRAAEGGACLECYKQRMQRWFQCTNVWQRLTEANARCRSYESRLKTAGEPLRTLVRKCASDLKTAISKAEAVSGEPAGVWPASTASIVDQVSGERDEERFAALMGMIMRLEADLSRAGDELRSWMAY